MKPLQPALIASGLVATACVHRHRVGVIDYEIRETAHDQVISRGRAVLSQIKVEDWNGDDGFLYQTKRVNLDEHFVIELVSSDEDRSNLTGFGMSLKRTDVRYLQLGVVRRHQ